MTEEADFAAEAHWETVLDEFDDPESEPYCQCDLDPTEDEDASNCCACCGKAIF